MDHRAVSCRTIGSSLGLSVRISAAAAIIDAPSEHGAGCVVPMEGGRLPGLRRLLRAATARVSLSAGWWYTAGGVAVCELVEIASEGRQWDGSAHRRVGGDY